MTEQDASLADASTPRYRSSAAARMVNIPVATLRVWERRYQVVGPAQAASGHRLYSSQDVRRLVLIKQLVNKGHGIGMLARMQTPQLQDLLHEAELAEGLLQRSTAPLAARPARVPEALNRLRVLLVGPDAGTRWRTTLEAVPELDVVGSLDASPQSELRVQHLQADMVVALSPQHAGVFARAGLGRAEVHGLLMERGGRRLGDILEMILKKIRFFVLLCI